jgi:hypothetical protein
LTPLHDAFARQSAANLVKAKASATNAAKSQARSRIAAGEDRFDE